MKFSQAHIKRLVLISGEQCKSSRGTAVASMEAIFLWAQKVMLKPIIGLSRFPSSSSVWLKFALFLTCTPWLKSGVTLPGEGLAQAQIGCYMRKFLFFSNPLVFLQSNLFKERLVTVSNLIVLCIVFSNLPASSIPSAVWVSVYKKSRPNKHDPPCSTAAWRTERGRGGTNFKAGVASFSRFFFFFATPLVLKALSTNDLKARFTLSRPEII